MLNEFTIGNVTYQIGGPNYDSIGLPIRLNNLPAELTIDGYRMVRKKAFHVTLVPVGNIAQRHEINDPNLLEELLKDFQQFVAQHPIRFLRLTNEFRFVTQNNRRTIVGMCEVENLDKFYATINLQYNFIFEVPPTHVTLYTLYGGPGIFLIDHMDIESLTKVIDNPGLFVSAKRN